MREQGEATCEGRLDRRVFLAALTTAACLLLASSARAQAPIPYATYLGSELRDSIEAIEIDQSGAVYVLGNVPNSATRLSFPFWTPTGQPTPFDLQNCYLAKLTPADDGTLTYAAVALIRESNGCTTMALAPNGDVVVARRSLHQQPIAVIDTFTVAGAGFTRTRQVQLPQMQAARHLRVDTAGNTYAVGTCTQQSIPTTLWPLPRGAQPNPSPGRCATPGSLDANDAQDLLAVVNAAGSLSYATFIGSGAQTVVSSLEVDTMGTAYLAGQTVAGLVNVTPNAYQPRPGDSGCATDCHPGDAFLVLIDPAQSGRASLEYASYFGGTSLERDLAMTLDASGRIYLAGNTDSRNSFPGASFTDSALFLAILDLSQDPAAQLISSTAVADNGATTLYGSFETVPAIRLLPSGSVALMADTTSSSFPLVRPVYSGPYDPAAANPLRPLVLVFDPATGAFTFASFLDDVQLARFPHIAVDPSGDLTIAMLTTEPGRSTDGTTPLGEGDVLLFRVDATGTPHSNSPPVADAGPDQTSESSEILLDASDSFDPDGDPLIYLWTEGTTTLGAGVRATVMLSAGTHTITLTVTDSHGATSTDIVIVTIQGADLSVSATPSALQVNALDTITYTATVTNNGPLDATLARLRVTLPAGMQLLSVAPAACTVQAQTIGCDFEDLASGHAVVVTLAVRAALAGTFSTSFSVSSPENDPDLANNAVTVAGLAGLFVAEAIHVSDNDPTPVPGVMLTIAELIHVSDDEQELSLGPATVPLTPPPNSPPGPQPVSVTFARVTPPVVVTVEALVSIPPLPAGFVLEGTAFEIRTTAPYEPPVVVCFGGTFTAQHSLLHYEGNAWQDVTSSRAPSEICGTVSSLSPFAVVKPAVTADPGKPAIGVRIVGNGTISGNRKFVDLELTNTGTGNAGKLAIDVVLLLPLKGFGLPRLVSPGLPVRLGPLDAGNATVVRVVFDVPPTVRELSVTVLGTFVDAKGRIGAYLETRRFQP